MIFFEDAYENGPDESVPRRSTFCKIECVYTAVEAGTLSFSMQSGANRIILHEGSSVGAVTTGGTWPLQQGDSGTKVFYAEGITASGATGDVCFKADFTPDEGGAQPCEDRKSITVVELEAYSISLRPSGYRKRHVYGVCEQVQIAWRPTGLQLNWNARVGLWKGNGQGWRQFQFPDGATRLSLEASLGSDNCYAMDFTCMEPSGVSCLPSPTAVQKAGLSHNEAGDIGMLLLFTVCPTNVSFENVRFMEIPSLQSFFSGYYSADGWRNMWYHGIAQGAGRIVTLNEDNDGEDEAYMIACPSPWGAGILTWVIPAAWQPPANSGSTKGMTEFTQYTQQFLIDGNGTVSVSKFGHNVERGTNTVKKVDGVIVP